MANSTRKHTFLTVQDLYEEVESENENKEKTTSYVLKRANVRLEYDCYLDDIRSVREIVNSETARKYSGRCQIYHEFDGPLVVIGSKKMISELVFGKFNSKVVGFNTSKEVNNEDRREINGTPDTGEHTGKKLRIRKNRPSREAGSTALPEVNP